MSTYETDSLEPDEQTTELPCDPEDLAVADTGAGFLVYEVEREYREHLGRETEIARRLIGFADVTDWDVIAEAVRARGRGHGDVIHLPEFDLEELPEPEA
jgi:5-methylthioribose kinase